MARRGLLLAFLMLGLPSMAFAQQLTWSAPGGCSSREKVLEAVKHTLGRAVETRRRFDVHVAVQPGLSGHVLVDFTAEEGEGSTHGRHFEAESCDAAAAATAVIVALLMDPTSATPDPAPDVASPSAPPPVPAPPPMLAPPVVLHVVTPPARVVPSQSRAPAVLGSSPEAHSTDVSNGLSPLAVLRLFSARLAVAGDVGTESHANVGAELAVGASLRAWRLEAVGGVWASGSATASASPGEGVRVGLASLGGRFAYRFESRAFGLAPFVGMEADHASATGFGGNSQASPTVTWTGADFGAVGTWWLTRWLALAVTAQAVVPLSRPTFVATNPPPAADFAIEQPSLIIGRASLGIECRFF